MPKRLFKWYTLLPCKLSSSTFSLILGTQPGKPGHCFFYLYFTLVMKVKVAQLCPTLCDPMDYAQTMEFSRPEYWNGLLFLPPGDLPDPGIKPGSPALQADSLPTQFENQPLTLPITPPASPYPVHSWESAG